MSLRALTINLGEKNVRNIFDKLGNEIMKIVTYDEATEDFHLIEFIQACRIMLKFLDAFGISLTSLRYEMESHLLVVETIENTLYEFSIEYLFEALLNEFHNGGYELTEAVLWLVRFSTFINEIITALLDDGLNSDMDETMENILERSYDKVFSSVHPWVSQKVFKALIVKSPRKKKLIKAFMYNKPCSVGTMKKSMSYASIVFSTLIENIEWIFNEHSLGLHVEQAKMNQVFESYCQD